MAEPSRSAVFGCPFLAELLLCRAVVELSCSAALCPTMGGGGASALCCLPAPFLARRLSDPRPVVAHGEDNHFHTVKQRSACPQSACGGGFVSLHASGCPQAQQPLGGEVSGWPEAQLHGPPFQAKCAAGQETFANRQRISSKTHPRGSDPTFSLCQKVFSITFQLGNNSAKERGCVRRNHPNTHQGGQG